MRIRMIVLLLILSVIDVFSLRADDGTDKPKAIQLKFPCDGKRDGVKFASYFFVNESGKVVALPEEVKAGTKMDLKTEVSGLTDDLMKGRRLAIQFIKRGEPGKKGVQRKIIWLDNPTKDDIKRGSFVIKSSFTPTEAGPWEVRTGLADPVKSEWWCCTSHIFSVK